MWIAWAVLAIAGAALTGWGQADDSPEAAGAGIALLLGASTVAFIGWAA